MRAEKSTFITTDNHQLKLRGHRAIKCWCTGVDGGGEELVLDTFKLLITQQHLPEKCSFLDT